MCAESSLPETLSNFDPRQESDIRSGWALAAQLFKRAADRGNASGQVNYSLCLRHGRRVEVDFAGAASYYKLAADQTEADGQVTYGVCLAGGQGVGVDFVGAVKYYRFAADQDNPYGQCNYGFSFQHPPGTAGCAERTKRSQLRQLRPVQINLNSLNRQAIMRDLRLKTAQMVHFCMIFPFTLGLELMLTWRRRVDVTNRLLRTRVGGIGSVRCDVGGLATTRGL